MLNRAPWAMSTPRVHGMGETEQRPAQGRAHTEQGSLGHVYTQGTRSGRGLAGCLLIE